MSKIANWATLISFSIDRINKGRLVAHEPLFKFEAIQQEILTSTRAFKIIRAARRTGKSFNVAFITYTLLIYSIITNRPLKIIFVGPTYEDARNMWYHLRMFLKFAPLHGAGQKDNMTSTITHRKWLTLSNGTFIKTGTCDDPNMNDVRGEGWDFIAIDEFGNVGHKTEFQNAAAPSLTDKNTLGWLMVIGTPDLSLGEEYDKLFELGQHNDPYYQSWHLTQEHSPNIDRERAQAIDSLLSEDGRLREIFGEQVPAGGKLFPEFNFKTHVQHQTYNEELTYFIGVDPGRTKPVIEFVQPDGDVFRVFHEITGHDIVVEKLIKEVKLAIAVVCKGNQPVIIGIDKAGNQKSDKTPYTTIALFESTFPQSSSVSVGPLVNKDNQTILYRKLTMQNRILIDPSCKRLITSFIKATPNMIGQHLKSGWKKVEGLDDPLDALMYGLINYAPGLIIKTDNDAPQKDDARQYRDALRRLNM